MKQRRRNIRSIFVRASVLLLLGAIVNVAVAWGCALLPPVTSNEAPPTQEDYWWLIRTGFTDHAFPVLHQLLKNASSDQLSNAIDQAWTSWWRTNMDGFRRSGAAWYFIEDGDLHARGIGLAGVRIRSGWPCLSVEGGLVHTPSTAWTAPQCARTELYDLSDAFRTEASVAGALRIPTIRRPLPFRPLWPGFAVNTLFFAAILGVISAAVGLVRRRLRIRSGRCPACAYPAGALPVCTECGAALPANARLYPTDS